MEGDALTVKMGNGFEVQKGALRFCLDPKTIASADLDGAVACISHAHSDHTPSKYGRGGTPQAVCSEFTRRFLHEFKGKNIGEKHDDHVKMHNAGHVPGSVMFEIDMDGEKVLYTGDFSPRDRFRIKGAKPVKVDVLIIEATYGLKKYRFPPTAGLVRIMKEWIDDSLAENDSVALFTSSLLGKSYELIHELKDFQPHVHSSMCDYTKLLERCGLELSYRDYCPRGAKGPSVVVCSNSRKAKEALLQEHHDSKHLRQAAVTGWVAAETKWFRRDNLDETFAISDHADYDELMAFVKGCDPSRVYVEHGFASELSVSIREELGIDASPVPGIGQQSLLNY
jgi:putative mRNA 3-end processing factor